MYSIPYNTYRISRINNPPTERFGGYSDEPGVRPYVNIFVSAQYRLEYFDDTSYLYRPGHDDVSRTNMRALPLLLFSYLPFDITGIYACVRAHHCTSIPYFSTSIVANDLFLQKGTTREDSDCAVSSESAFLRLQPRIMIRTSVHAEDLTNFKRNVDTADQPVPRKWTL